MADDGRRLTDCELEEVQEFARAFMSERMGRPIEAEAMPCVVAWIDDDGEERYLILNPAEEDEHA